MSENITDQLKDLRRLKAQWEDDPDQHTPFPLLDLLVELEQTVGVAQPEEPAPGEG